MEVVGSSAERADLMKEEGAVAMARDEFLMVLADEYQYYVSSGLSVRITGSCQDVRLILSLSRLDELLAPRQFCGSRARFDFRST